MKPETTGCYLQLELKVTASKLNSLESEGVPGVYKNFLWMSGNPEVETVPGTTSTFII